MSTFVWENVRWNLIGILIEEGLKPDFFAFPINFSTAGGKWFRALGYKWLTPLSFVMAYSPFGDESIEAVKLLIRKGWKRRMLWKVSKKVLPNVFFL